MYFLETINSKGRGQERETENTEKGKGRRMEERGDKDLKRSHFSHNLKFKYMHRIMVC